MQPTKDLFGAKHWLASARNVLAKFRKGE